MQERNVITVLLLMIVTCGVYYFYHAYVTTQELADTISEDFSPGMDLLLSLVTCGLFGMYVTYRNQQAIDNWYNQSGLQHPEQAQTIGLMLILTFVVGVTWYVAIFMHQEELNRLANDLSQYTPPLLPAA